ncbi:MAG: hypothetical protein ACYC66_14205 [Chloroflexota bacterium]
MADLLISDSDRDALVGAGLLLGTMKDAATFRVVASLPEASRLLHDARRAYTRILICGVPAADSGSLRSALTVLQARGTGVWWFDSHELLWTTEVRNQLDHLEVNYRLPDPHRPETERTSGLVLAHLLDQGDPRATKQATQLQRSVAQLRRVEMGGPDWLALVDAVEHDHRLVTNRAIKGAALRVWDPEAPLEPAEQRLVALQRSREARVGRFLERLADDQAFDQELLRFDAEQYKELRYIRSRMYTELARRRMAAEYAQARVDRGWTFACRDPYRMGLDLPVAFLERLFDLDVTVHGYPYRANVRVLGGADVDERLGMALETALEEERTGRRRPVAFPAPEEEIDW